MTRVARITSKKEYVRNTDDTEYCTFTADGDISTGFRSEADDKAVRIEGIIKDVVGKAWKEFDYEILVMINSVTGLNGERRDVSEAIVLMDCDAKAERVRDPITDSGVVERFSCGVMSSTGRSLEKTSELADKTREWAEAVQAYLRNNTGFRGSTTVRAAAWQGRVLSLDISPSGKGTNDGIVYSLKNLADNVRLSMRFFVQKEEIMELLVGCGIS